MSSENLIDRFSSYFKRDVAEQAAKSISNGAEIEFQIFRNWGPGQQPGKHPDEVFTFIRKDGKNSVTSGPAREPQLIFTLSEQAAKEILDFQSDNIGEIGVHIAKMVIASRGKHGEGDKPDCHVGIHFKSGFFGLFTKGYLGVLTHGGAQFASYLASHGLNGIGAIKSILKKQ